MAAAFGHPLHGLLQGGAVGDLVGGHAEFGAHRIGHLAAHQGHGGRHRVAGLQRADDHLQGLGQLEAEGRAPAAGLELQHGQRDQRAAKDGPAGQPERRLGQEPDQKGAKQGGGAHIGQPFPLVVGQAGGDDQVRQPAQPFGPAAAGGETPLFAQLHHQGRDAIDPAGDREATVYLLLLGGHAQQPDQALGGGEHRQPDQHHDDQPGVDDHLSQHLVGVEVAGVVRDAPA